MINETLYQNIDFRQKSDVRTTHSPYLGRVGYYPAERITVQQTWKCPVPTAHEVKLLFDALPEYDAMKVAFGLLVVGCMRPTEMVDLTWNDFFINKKSEVEHLTHRCYKARNYSVSSGNAVKFKEVLKPVYRRSRWLHEQLTGYAKVCPDYYARKLFPWTCPKSPQKRLQKLRLKLVGHPDYSFLADENGYVVKGENGTKYRITTYALRRFGITWLYYTEFNRDEVALARHIGHSNPRTTMEHYVMPREAIGLTQGMIDDKISLDDFIHLKGKNQMQLVDYVPEWKAKFSEVGQTTLLGYTK